MFGWSCCPSALFAKKNRLRTMPGVSHAQGASIALGLGAHHSNAPEEGGANIHWKEILVDNKKHTTITQHVTYVFFFVRKNSSGNFGNILYTLLISSDHWFFTCFPGSLCLQENLRMKQVHPPASLVLLVLLPRSKAPLAALFVLEGSLDRWRYIPMLGASHPTKKLEETAILWIYPHPWKPGDLCKITGDLGGFRHRFRRLLFETKKPRVLLIDQEGAPLTLAVCLLGEIFLVGDAMGSIGKCTLPETNIAPKNGWLEYWFPFGMTNFQVLC